MKYLGRPILASLILLLATGCRNPFDPAADLRLERFFCNGGLIVTIDQSTAISMITTSGLGVQQVRADISNFSTVGGVITSYSVVYRQLTAQPAPVNLPAGSPIPALGGAAGRRFSLRIHFQGLRDDTNSNGFNTFSVSPRVITAELLSYIGGSIGSSTVGGGIDCEIVFFGEDHNGHELKVPGVLHVQVD